MQLVTGSSVQQPQMFGPPKSQKMDPEPVAIFAFLCGVLGLALSFVKGRAGAIAPAAAGGLAAILLLPMRSAIEGDALKQGGGVIQVNYEAGFYIVVILFLATVGLNIFVLMQGKGLPLPALKVGGDTKFCTQCGSRNASADLFCKECGEKLS